MASSSTKDPTVKFSISGEDEPLTDEPHMNGDEPKSNGDGPNARRSRRGSRFQVARVDFAEEPVIERDNKPDKNVGFTVDNDDSDERGGGELSPDSYQRSVSYDTNNLRTFAHNTLETLPHVDHYRNLLSTTGHMRKRPTLLELHDMAEQVCL